MTKVFDKPPEELDGGDVTEMVDAVETLYVQGDDVEPDRRSSRGSRRVKWRDLVEYVDRHGAIQALRRYKGSVVSDGEEVPPHEVIERLARSCVPNGAVEYDDSAEAAYELLYILHHKVAFIEAGLYVKSDRVEDIVHSAFAQGWYKLKQGHYRPGNFGGWLRILTRNYALDSLRKHSAQYEVMETDMAVKVEEQDLASLGVYDTDTPEEIAVSDQLFYEYSRAIARLPQPMQEIYNLREIEGWSYQDIADRHNISEGRARAYVHDAIAELYPKITK